MLTPKLSLPLTLVLVAGCSGEGPVTSVPDDLSDDSRCPAIFAQTLVPEYHVTISDTELSKLEQEFKNRPITDPAGFDHNPYHPIELRYQDIVVPDAMIRLKGQSSWFETVALDANPKMQFVISFNEINDKGRFYGVRKLELDMPRSDHSFLQQRLALWQFRKSGINAQCANSARLFLNGKYYGLYTNLERMDKEFLQRSFGADDEGDLWEGGRIIQTNEETFHWTRLDMFWHLGNLAQLSLIVDFDLSVRMWSVDAMMGNADGYYNGRANFFLYDHPTRGFMWLPHDLDTAFNATYLPPDTSPLFTDAPGRNKHDREHWALVMDDAAWLDRYVAMLTEARASFDVKALQARVDGWSAQIAPSVVADPHFVSGFDDHRAAVAAFRSFVARRAEAVDTWLTCRNGGGPDLDRDGYSSCYDCVDNDATAFPGAAELCNGRDDDCDGRTDDAEALTCQ